MDGQTVEKYDPYTYEGSPNVEVKDGLVVVFIGVVLFSVFNYLACIYGPPKSVKGEVWRWRNTFVSWLHAVVIGVACFYCSIFKKDVLEEKILYCDRFIYSIISLSLGYFIYDLLDVLVNKRMFKNYEIVLHHFWVILTFGYNMVYKIYVPYNIIALMVEVNSIFLHGRKLMQIQQWSFNDWQYKLVVAFNLLTFVFYRMYAVLLIARDLPLRFHELTLTYQVYMTSTIVFLATINFILLWRIFKNDVLRNLLGSKEKVVNNGKGS